MTEALKPTLFVDLDDTLFRSGRKRASEGCHPVAFDREGNALSYMNENELAFFRQMSLCAEIIPVTARNHAAFERVDLEFSGPAICSFGGLVLEADGAASAEWQTHVERANQATLPTLHALLRRAETENAHEFEGEMLVRLIGEGDKDFYLQVKHKGREAEMVASFADHTFPKVPPGWQRHLNANNLAILPPWLGKHHAVRFVMDSLRKERGLTIGMGDSLTDLGFMGLCDLAVTPADSQIFRQLTGRGA